MNYHRPMIARMKRCRQASLCLSMEDLCSERMDWFDCTDGKCTESPFHLDIYRAGCPEEPCRPPPCRTCGYCDPCEHRPEPQPAVPPARGVRYPIWSLDKKGRACFMLDSKVLEDKPGRYEAYVFNCDTLIGHFQIELRDSYRIKEIITVPATRPATC